MDVEDCQHASEASWKGLLTGLREPGLAKDRDEQLAFYDFPAEYWVHIRTTNPIESTFASVRLMAKRSRSCGSRETTLAMVFKLLLCAEKRWNRITRLKKQALAVNNDMLQNGEQLTNQSDRGAA
ncbi:transposase [Halomonas sp. NO4]|uniref:transposase n=1 Tax=Halomonas sp. NO4 TaxID=2484813 RepID=UPI001F091A0C|nr:transposase [Halomonas sp. NO4]